MKAVTIDRFGGNEVIQIRDVPVPALKPGHVLVRVRAAGVNPVDWKIRSGKAWLLTGRRFPKILGLECSGTIAEVDPLSSDLRPGDEVIAFTGVRSLGAYAEYVLVPLARVYAKPAGVGFEEAATIPIAGLTALQALRDKGQIGTGSKVLINGASGGVGHYAVQIASLLGAEVTGVCSRQNLEFVRGLGADRVLDYQKVDFVRNSDKYDLVFDTVSVRTFGECRKVLLPHGVYVATLPSLSIICNQYLTGYVSNRKAYVTVVSPNPADVAWVASRVQSKQIRVVLDQIYPLDQIREAFSLSETHRTRGKIGLRIS